jgi:carboxyl-terminal processing protease
MKPILAKTRADKIFKGQLIVLVDSESASAAELFARIIQLEKRGIIIGDHTAGAVMTSRDYNHQVGIGNTLYFGTSVTIADVIMPDGKSLENVGVMPDELLLPGESDIAKRLDPVLARAAAIAGLQLEPEKAGKLFPVEWLKL